MLIGTDDHTRRTLAALELLVRFSQLIAEQRWLKEVLLRVWVVLQVGLLVHDTQVVVYDAAVQAYDLPALAIRTYPAQYVTQWMLRDGTPVTIDMGSREVP